VAAPSEHDTQTYWLGVDGEGRDQPRCVDLIRPIAISVLGQQRGFADARDRSANPLTLAKASRGNRTGSAAVSDLSRRINLEAASMALYAEGGRYQR
jgi:hypothetical protein